MRLALAAVLAAAAVLPGAALAAQPPAEAAPALDAIKSRMRVERNISFRKVKINAAGDVCGTVSVGSGRDMEFLLAKSSGELWINEAPTEPNSYFGYGLSNVRRSTERADYQIWKSCQKG